MARSRNIKPGFFANEELADLPFEARLLFIGLWTLADREGRLEDRPKRIRAQVFPYDSIDAEPLMAMLAAAGFIVRYEAAGERFAQILNFTKHQMPHHKEVASEIPAPEGYKQITRHAYDVPAKVREEVFSRDGGACLKCGSLEDLSLDHIQALGSGGDNSINNLQTLCTSCNSSKGNSTKDYRKANVDPTSNQRQSNHVASCPSDSLSSDSSLLIPDSLKERAPRKRSAPPVDKPMATIEQLTEAGIPADVAAEFIAHKAEHKAPLTERAWRDHLVEAQKAGWTPLQAAEKVMAKSWKGFESKYVAGEPVPGKVTALTSFAQQEEAARRRRWEEMTGRKWPTDGDVIDMENPQQRISA